MHFDNIVTAELKSAGLWLLVLLSSLVVVVWLPAPDAARGLGGYLPLHTAMEVIAVAVAAMVFGISWATQRFHQESRVATSAESFEDLFEVLSKADAALYSAMRSGRDKCVHVGATPA